MARQRISEYRAKSLLFTQLGLPYTGISVNADKDISLQLTSLNHDQRYVVKVDQGVKKRMKRGLISLNKEVNEISQAIEEMKGKGFTQFVIEPMAEYDSQDEHYFAIERMREGYKIFFSKHGGIDIEEHENSVKSILIPYSSREEQSDESSPLRSAEQNGVGQGSSIALPKLYAKEGRLTSFARTISEEIGLPEEKLAEILTVFDDYYFSFLEINPLVVKHDSLSIIDLAVEVDNVADFFVTGGWTSADFTYGEKKAKTDEERVVAELKEQSQAAFTLDILNPDGSIFMLLSGGGASLVLADEVANMGLGEQLANYGEYSGNPNAEETYLYTTQVLKLLLRSSAPHKVLIIGGGVANFTDIKATFKGVIKALDEHKDALREQRIRVFVRRGGPNQAEGLSQMKAFLEKEQLLGRVVGPDVLLTDIVKDAALALEN